jgi:ABC-type dipeptide/oligopeptide/nickel transport system permease component
MFYSFLLAAVMLSLNRGWGGNWPLTVLIVVLGSLFMVAVGLVMGAVFQNAGQVNTWSTLVLMALMMPSWLTVVQMPEALEVVFRLMPTHYMVQALGLTLAGQATLAKLWLDVAVMAGSAAAALAAVVWMLRRELQ